MTPSASGWLPTVALVGRPNVGKSTLFNRILGRRAAVVYDRPGVTVDRHYAVAEVMGRHFSLIDTGGFEPDADPESERDLFGRMRQQAVIAATQADVVVFVVDGMAGMLPADRQAADLLRRLKKPVIVAVNKLDSLKKAADAWEFAELGFPDVVPVSAAHGENVGDFMDVLVAHLPPPRPGATLPTGYDGAIAVIGRPNVGKSTLVNRLLGEDRQVVSPIAGTTRDAIDSDLQYKDHRYLLVDTAGIRRQASMEALDKLTLVSALKALDRADVALFLIDAIEGPTHQDARILGYAREKNKALILLVNKWDRYEKDHRSVDQLTEVLRNQLGFVSYAPVLFVSALTGQRVNKVLELVGRVLEQHRRRIPTAPLNRWLQQAQARHSPPVVQGKRPKFYFMTQVETEPPTFVVVTNTSKQIHYSYRRYLDNRLREAFGFEGTPLRLLFREKARSNRGLRERFDAEHRELAAEGMEFVEWNDDEVTVVGEEDGAYGED